MKGWVLFFVVCCLELTSGCARMPEGSFATASPVGNGRAGPVPVVADRHAIVQVQASVDRLIAVGALKTEKRLGPNSKTTVWFGKEGVRRIDLEETSPERQCRFYFQDGSLTSLSSRSRRPDHRGVLQPQTVWTGIAPDGKAMVSPVARFAGKPSPVPEDEIRHLQRWALKTMKLYCSLSK